MATITQLGALNTTALVVPGLYVQIVPPQNLVLNGVPTNVVGAVGTAQWGPVGQPVVIGTMAQQSASFGAIQNRKYDMGTAIAAAIQQGAQNFRCVRVTDGTDVAAVAPVNGTVTSNCGAILTARYTGSLGNALSWQIVTGSTVGSFKLIVGASGFVPEYYDNLVGSGATFWTNLIAAVNNGNAPSRGPSQFVVASAGAGAGLTAAPTLTTTPQLVFTGGTDGVTTITSAVLVGTDGLTRTGMYALRGQGCSVAMLVDADTSSQWTNQATFGLSEGIYMIGVAPASSPITNGSTGSVDLLQASGAASYSFKLLHGDWCWWNDTVNGVTRLISPQGFAAGRYGNMSPEQSGLNKQLYNVVGTQTTGLPGAGQSSTYSSAQLQVLFQAGIDVIMNPVPGGNYFGLGLGHNTSVNAANNGDNYTRLTNYIASTLAAGMGLYVGQVINATLFQNIRATMLSFLQNMLGQGQLGSTTGQLPFSVVCDISNNPFSRTSLNYVQADATVQYMGINEKFLVNLNGGQGVQVSVQTTPSGQVAA